MRHRFAAGSLVVVLSALAVGCGGNNREAARSTGPSGLGQTETTSGTVGAVASRNEESDDALLGIVTATDKTVLDQANLALERSRNDAVRAYAKRIIDDHEKTQRKVETLMAESPLTPATSDEGNRIYTSGGNALARLVAASGSEFDRSYAALQAEEQDQLAKNVDALVTHANDKKLRHLLESERGLVSDHRDDAKTLKNDVK